MKLRDRATERGILPEHPVSAGRLLNLLTRRELIPAEVIRNLQYAIMVSNRAIHGESVSIEEAEEAVFNADIGLQRLASME